MSAQLLTKKQRELPPGPKVQTLQRIARRATVKADWLATFLPGGENNHGADWQDTPEARAEIAALRAKALAATTELCNVVNENPDYPFWTPQQRAAAQRFLGGAQ